MLLCGGMWIEEEDLIEEIKLSLSFTKVKLR